MSRWVSWSLVAVALALAVAMLGFDAANGHRIAPPIAEVVTVLAFLVVGALVVGRRPRNPIGWIFLVGMVLIVIGGRSNLAEQYGYYATVTRPGSLPAADWVVWAGQLALTVAFSTIVTFTVLLFPDGRLAAPRWRPVAVAGVVALVGLALSNQLAPGPLQVATLRNPIGVGPAAGALDLLHLGSAILNLVVVLLSVASAFARFRAANGPEREQLKWFAYGAAWIPAVGVGALVLGLMGAFGATGLGSNLWPLSVTGIPIATGVAILRYRLYDIDVIINRTLVYGALSITLAALYFLAVLAFEALTRPLTAGSELSVALSTLAVVALVAPLRRRIQALVDRRFYRSRYDAARTVDEFSVRLRDEVDLDAVRSGLLGAVNETVQPVYASVWLREQRS